MRASELGRLAGAALVAAMIAGGVNVLLAVASGSAITMSDGSAPMPIAAIVGGTVVGVACATVVWPAVAVRAKDPAATLIQLAAVTVPVTWVADVPLLFMGMPALGVLVLMFMHVVDGVIVYVSLTWIAPAPTPITGE